MEVEFEGRDINLLQSSDNILSPEQIETQLVVSTHQKISNFLPDKAEGTQSTFSTSLVIFNNMIGITIMILPYLFLKCGIFTSLIVMFLIAFANFFTCNICVSHLNNDEADFPQVVERILGTKCKIFCVISSITMLFSTGVVFLILMNNMFYSSLTFIFELSGFHNYALKSDIRFDIYSYQINSFILVVPCFLSCFFKKIDFIAPLSKIGVYVLCLYILFLIYIFIDNKYQGNTNGNPAYWTSNITEISGACSMAFFVHLSICSVIKQQKNKNEYTKSVILGYTFSYFFYFFVGIIGCYGLYGRSAKDNHPQTIMDFFGKNSFVPFVIEILYFFKLISVYPIFSFISKTQLMSLIPKNKRNCRFINHLLFIYNIVYILIGEICVIFNFDLTFVVGFSAAVFGFFLSYLLPILLHLNCYSNNRNKNTGIANDENKCNSHKSSTRSIKWKFLFYFVLIFPIGIYLLAIQIMALINLRWTA